MGIYKVQSNGKAPKGLSSGDQVVTAGGTYVITAVKPDGSYNSVMYNAAQTTANYTGPYDSPGGASAVNGTAAGSGSAGSTAGSSAGSGPLSSAAAEQQYLGLIQQSLNSSYTPTKAENYQGISFSKALELAGQSLQPQYKAAYKQAAEQAGQRLEKAGLYDTLYGQALSAQAEGQVTQALGEAVYKLALQLMENSTSAAEEQRQQDAAEQQYSSKLTAQNQQNALDALLQLIKLKQS